MANPVSKTAYYCAGVRMLDAQSKRPVVADTFAERFMGEEGKAIFEPFRNERLPNGSNVARCHLIDEVARAHLKAHPGGLVVLVGAGFDSRAFRLPGGRWVEVDEAPVIARKEQVAPQASCPNELARISIHFASEKLADKLAAYATGDAVLVIVEGVLVYLEESQIAELARALAALFPHHTLACDMSSRAFHVRTQDSAMHRTFDSWGARFRWKVDEPEKYVAGLGYTLKSRTSIVLTATQLGLMPIPRLGARFFLPKVIREGLSVCVFERG